MTERQQQASRMTFFNCLIPRPRQKVLPAKFYVKPKGGSRDEKAQRVENECAEGGQQAFKISRVASDSRLSACGAEQTERTHFSCRRVVSRLHCWFLKLFRRTFAPQSLWYLTWLGLVTICYLYNILSIILRTTFQPEGYYSSTNYHIWMAVDYICDLVYLIDLLIVKPRLQFIQNGLAQTHVRNTMRNYVRSSAFKFDLLSLTPLDLFYIYTGVLRAAPLLRLPRYLKLKTAWEFFDRCDQISRSGYVVRVIRTMIYMLFLIHVETCGYYAISYYEGIGSNQWVFQGEGIAYIRCFYLATKTATSIGNNPKPTNQLEYMFMTVYWLSGVFVFALLIGQVRDIFESANSVKSNYQKAQDSTLQYLQNLNVPKPLQHRVRDWFNYNWEQQKTLNENLLVDVLPTKMKSDLFLSVHMETLEQVSLFKNVERSLLSDLILKLIPVIFLPGDIICRKGEVGTAMYIIMHGEVEVVDDDGSTLANLPKGHVFGEISLVGLNGGNRRTATVRSKGYSSLFLLSKYDFDGAMKDYPAAYAQLRARAQKLLKKAPMKSKSLGNNFKAIAEEPDHIKQFSNTRQKERVTQLFTVCDAVEMKKPTGADNTIQMMSTPADEQDCITVADTEPTCRHTQNSRLIETTSPYHTKDPNTPLAIDSSEAHITAFGDTSVVLSTQRKEQDTSL